ncbi:MAG TPA: hypothetical protein IGS31_14560 [Oscillatoriales cyanobacterium M4454_W2019_049]|nr:hypothetical protein [Oscillatoriales cyanobacterium M4454_W2019_049]
MPITGTNGNDSLIGTSGNDSIVGYLGVDTIQALSGNDTIIAFEGRDLIFGNAGLDAIDLDTGGTSIGSTVYAGADNDTIDGTLGGDTIYGDLGADLIAGIDGNDILIGTNVNNDQLNDVADRISGNNGNDLVYGNSGNDSLYGDAGNDTVYGGKNDDFISGALGADLLYGDDGNDVIAGFNNSTTGGGFDTLTGGAGGDKFAIAYGDLTQFSIITDFTGTGASPGDRVSLNGLASYPSITFERILTNYDGDSTSDLLLRTRFSPTSYDDMAVILDRGDLVNSLPYYFGLSTQGRTEPSLSMKELLTQGLERLKAGETISDLGLDESLTQKDLESALEDLEMHEKAAVSLTQLLEESKARNEALGKEISGGDFVPGGSLPETPPLTTEEADVILGGSSHGNLNLNDDLSIDPLLGVSIEDLPDSAFTPYDPNAVYVNDLIITADGLRSVALTITPELIASREIDALLPPWLELGSLDPSFPLFDSDNSPGNLSLGGNLALI